MAETLVTLPPNLTQIVQFATQFVLRNKLSTGQNTTGAVLAHAIRADFPNLPFHHFSKGWLAEIVKAAETEKLLIRIQGVQHLEVQPGSAAEKLEAAQEVLVGKPVQRYIRSEIWRAFVITGSDEVHFLDRDTKQLITVTASDSTAVSRYNDNPRYELVKPIPAEKQQSWMREFLSLKKLDDKEAPIQQDRWWQEFPVWLREQNQSLEQEWRRMRGRWMFADIRNWAGEAGIDFRTLSRPSKTILEVPSEYLPDISPTVENPAERKAIIAAVADMPIEELKDLKIPVRYILRYLKIR